MKTIVSLLILVSLFGLQAYSQQFHDDVYFTPRDAERLQNQEVRRSAQAVRPNIKNGAREIIYIDSRNNNTNIVIARDTVYVIAEANDSIMAEYEISDETGYYLDGFTGGSTELEYAERIRRFHNPKYTIHISDPQYTDIYFLNNHDWNVYVDGSYAWVTPTWTNPFWWNYYWQPYSYNSWAWRSWRQGWGWHGGWYGHHQPWGFGYPNYHWYLPYHYHYGGFYTGVLGWGYPHYHHYSYWHNPYWGGGSFWGGSTGVGSNRRLYYSEQNRRNQSGFATNAVSSGSRTIGGASQVNTAGRASAVASGAGRNEFNTVRAASPSSRSEYGDVRPVSNLRNTRTAESGVNVVDTRTRTVDNNAGRTGNVITNNRNTQITTRNNETVNRTTTVNSRNTTTSSSGNVNQTVRVGSGTAPVRNNTVSSSSSSTVNANRTTTTQSSTSGTSTTVRSSTPTQSVPSSSGTTVRSSTPTYSAPSSSGGATRSSGMSTGGSSSGGASRSSGGASSGGGRR